MQGSYKAYCLYVHNMDFFANPNAKEEDMRWKPSRFHQDLCDRVQTFIEKPTKEAFEIMIINTPPQHGKSTTITETLPSWYLMKHPDNSVIQISYGDELAERFGKRNLEKVKEHGHIFGVQVDPKKSTSKQFEILDRQGRLISRGIKSPLTGFSGHLIVIDDPVKNREQADSDRIRDSIWEEFHDSIISRAQAGTKIVLIMTRWHEDDLAGRILADPEFSRITTYVNYECECESDDDPLGRRKRTEDEPGEPLCPEIGKGAEWLKSFKAIHISEQGRRSWEALYQGHPTIMEGNILKKAWWKRYSLKDYEKGELRFERMIMSVDATFKDQEKNDFVSIQVWGKIENRFYLVHLVNEHLSFSNTIRRIRLLQAAYPKAFGVYIEDAANGPAIIDSMRHEIAGLIPVKTNGMSKESRVWAVEPAVEAGNCYIPDDRSGDKFIEQCAKFPNDKHDDMVDAFVIAVSRLNRTGFGKIKDTFKEAASGWTLPKDRPKKKLDIGRKINAI